MLGKGCLKPIGWPSLVITRACKEWPDDPGLHAQYHNHLMTLCGLKLRELVVSMTQAAEKAKQAAVKHAAKRRKKGESVTQSPDMSALKPREKRISVSPPTRFKHVHGFLVVLDHVKGLP